MITVYSARVKQIFLLAVKTAQTAPGQVDHKGWVDNGFLTDMHKMFGHHSLCSQATYSPLAGGSIHAAPVGAKRAMLKNTMRKFRFQVEQRRLTVFGRLTDAGPVQSQYAVMDGPKSC